MDSLLEILRKNDLAAVAERISYLRQLAIDDPDEAPMSVNSLRALAMFLLSERWLPHPQISVTPDGLVQAEWRLPAEDGDSEDFGVLVLEFRCSGLIGFAAVSEPSPTTASRSRASGAKPKAEMLQAVWPFTASLREYAIPSGAPQFHDQRPAPRSGNVGWPPA